MFSIIFQFLDFFIRHYGGYYMYPLYDLSKSCFTLKCQLHNDTGENQADMFMMLTYTRGLNMKYTRCVHWYTLWSVTAVYARRLVNWT